MNIIRIIYQCDHALGIGDDSLLCSNRDNLALLLQGRTAKFCRQGRIGTASTLHCHLELVVIFFFSACVGGFTPRLLVGWPPLHALTIMCTRIPGLLLEAELLENCSGLYAHVSVFCQQNRAGIDTAPHKRLVTQICLLISGQNDHFILVLELLSEKVGLCHIIGLGGWFGRFCAPKSLC